MFSCASPDVSQVPLLICYSSKEIKRTATGIMLMAIILMWISTVADCIGTLMWAVEAYTVTSTFTSSLFDRTRVMLDCLPDATGAIDFKKCQQELRVPYWGQSLHSWWATTAYHHHDCISTAALTVNVSASLSLVMALYCLLSQTGHHWRLDCLVACLGSLAGQSACPLDGHPHGLAQYGYIFCVFLTCAYVLNVLSGMGIVDTRDACTRPGLSLLSPSGLLPGAPIPASDLDAFAIRGILFGGDVWGYAAGLSSLLTNIVATTLIAYRAWCAHDPLCTRVALELTVRTIFTGRTVASLCHTCRDPLRALKWSEHSRFSSSPVCYTVLFG